MKKLHFSIVVSLLFSASVSTTWAQSRAYATNEGSGSVSVIDTATDTVVSTIDTGGKPRGLTLCKGSQKLFVTEQVRYSAQEHEDVGIQHRHVHLLIVAEPKQCAALVRSVC